MARLPNRWYGHTTKGTVIEHYEVQYDRMPSDDAVTATKGTLNRWHIQYTTDDTI